jgi:hypothetical protein
MNLTRRHFLTTATLAGTGLALDGHANSLSAMPPKKRIKLGISTYSYWHFKTAKVPIETVIDKAAVLGVEGVDILHRQMDIPRRNR